ncbi:MAG: hypothetical protein ABI863_13605 [Ginsengibacter sp.]
MTLKIHRIFRKSFVKVSLIIISIFVLGLACVYIWFVHNSDKLLIDLVNQKSGGKLELKLSSVSFNFFSSEIRINRATIASTNKDHTPIAYKVSFRRIVLHTNSIWSLLKKRSLEIRQIKLYDPTIEVFNLQKESALGSKDNLSLGLELGKLYNSIEDAISALNTHSISIINATLILNNKTDTTRRPLIFSNIYFTLKKLNKHRGLPGGYLNSNNIIFSSSNQDISLTDGIHKLLFKKLAVQQGRNIILDSCTIIALPTQTSGNSYNIHFKRLALIGVDFDTLYKTNLIRADSVYCENPVTNINLNPNVAGTNVAGTNVAGKGVPDLEKIIQQFSGDLDLGFVGVRNADIHVNITGRRGRSNINSGKGDFQIKNLRINPDSSNPISIKSFDMLIKGYLLYNADSSCVYSFDSIRFANDKLLLNNFTVHTASGINKIRSFRDYTMPYFELLGLDWPELIFKQNLKATEAVLHDPTINYAKAAKASLLKKTLIFTSQHTFDNFMELERLKIINGKINIKWGSNNFLQLEGLNLSLLPNALKSYTDVRLQENVESLFFSAGDLRIGDIKARLLNVIFKANDHIYAKEVVINSNLGEIDSKINNVSIKNIYTEPSGNILIDGLKWEYGNIIVNSIPQSKTNTKRTSFLLKNISGKQTGFKFINNKMDGNAFIENVGIASLVKKGVSPIEIKGFTLKAKEIGFSNSFMHISSTGCILSDASQELFKARFERTKQGDTLIINTPYVQVMGNINSFFANDLHLGQILLKSPVIDFYKQNTSTETEHKISQLPSIKIDHVSIREPVVNALVQQDASVKKFSLPWPKKSEIKVDDVEIAPGGIKMAGLHIKAQKAEFSGTGKAFKIDDGMDADLSKINISAAGHSPSWIAMLNKLDIKNSGWFTFDIKENKLLLKDISVGDCMLSSSSVNNVGELINTNPDAWVSTSAAKYSTKNSSWQFFHIKYHAGNKLLVLDSLNYHPAITRDSFIAANPYQVDYINFSAGNTSVYGLDRIKSFNGDSLSIQKASISNPSIVVFRDKFPPFLAGIRKELFTEKIRKINMPVLIKEIDVNDGNVSYTEKNETNRLEGNLMLTGLDGTISNITNYDLKRGDSLGLAFTGHILGKASFKLKLNQSYADPLFGFNMALNIEPAELIFLNPLLAPLSNIKFISGNIEKFEMNASGNENFAQGDMKFYYHKLRIQLLRNGGTTKSKFIKPAESALINAFILKKNNREGTGLIYFKRLKDRSFFNYMNKIIFSGISTSVGAEKNSHYKKKIAKDTAGK